MDSIPWAEWPARRWGWSEGWHPDVDLCVQALVTDGLRVPPFDRHPAGSGRLVAAGLTVELWQEWLERVIERHVVWRAESAWPAWERSAEWPPSRAPPPPPAIDLWDGPEAVRDELRSISLPGDEEQAPLLRYRNHELIRQEVVRFRGRVPHFWVFVVHYRALVHLAVRPAAIVMSERVWVNPPVYRGQLLQAVAELSAG